MHRFPFPRGNEIIVISAGYISHVSGRIQVTRLLSTIMVKLQKVVFAALVTFFYCETIAADGSLQLLENRAAYYGGYPLSIDFGATCPAGTYSCDSEHIGGPCCPTNNFCANAGTICCPTGRPSFSIQNSCYSILYIHLTN
jgi:hypothetical protein